MFLLTLSYYVSKYVLFLKTLYGFSIICLPNIFVWITIFEEQWKHHSLTSRFFFFLRAIIISQRKQLCGITKKEGRKRGKEALLKLAITIISLQEGLKSRTEFWKSWGRLGELSWTSLIAQMVKNLPAMQETRFNPWVGKIPWRREWQPTPVFLPGESHGQRSLVGYSPWGQKESDTMEWLTLPLFTSVKSCTKAELP